MKHVFNEIIQIFLTKNEKHKLFALRSKKIGTEAWIDASGYLRQKDYIADKDGYRILKSKTIFVGKSRPIKVSLK